jgi:gliding motility-associated-like protein
MNSLLRFYRFPVIMSPVRKVLKPLILIVFFVFMTFFNESDAALLSINPVLPPVAVCKNISVQLGAGGTAVINGSDVDGGSYDPDGTIASRTVSPNTFNCSQIGLNSVVLTVTDNEGKTSICTATVNVEDKTNPVILCKNITLYLDDSGNGTLKVADINNGSNDNCSSGLVLNLSRTSFNCSDIGSPVIVTLIGIDASGNTSSCTSQVTVLDTIAPVINYKPFTLVLGSSGSGTLLPQDIDNGSYDNCGTVSLSVSPGSFSCIDLGQKTVKLTALDSHGNSSSRNVTVTISSTVDIISMSLSTCNMSPTLALFDADTEGGDGNYSYFWRGLNASAMPFMVIIPFPPSLTFSNTTVLESPFFNNTMANGYYDIRLVVTDGKGCTDSTQIKINKTGAIFNNQTMRQSQACEGEIKTHSVNYKSDAVYSWSVTNGTILNSNQDTSRISIRWNLGVVQGRIVTTIRKPNILFPGGQCEATIIDTVTVTPVPAPVFSNPVTSVCSNSTNTYTLTGSYAYQSWTVTGGVITGGGNISDNFVTVRWGSGPAGSISVAAGNNSACTGSVLINIAVSNLSGSILSKTDIACKGGSNGSVAAAADPGTGQPPYSYSLNGGAFQSSGTFGSLTAGTYSITIRDAYLCTAVLSVTITEPSLPLEGNIDVTNISCFGGNSGACRLTVNGGPAPYSYLWSNGAVTQDIINVTAGNYSVTVTDSNGCTVIVNASLTQPSVVLGGNITSHSDVSAYGGNDGSLTVAGSGGTSPYEYCLDGGSFQTSGTFSSLTAGNYTITVRDAAMCTFNMLAIITQPWIPLTAHIITQNNVSCQGGNNGTVVLEGWGGTLPYLYSIDGGAFQASGTFGSLTAGTHIFSVRDAAMDLFIIPITITEASALDVAVSGEDVRCFGGNTGSVTASVTGGTGPYTYSWNSVPVQATPTAAGLTAGNYTVTVTDANGCTATNNVTISQPASGMVVAITQENILCAGGTNGSATATVTGGLEPYTFSWNTIPVQTKETATDLSAGTFTITITDSFGCIKTAIVNITEPQPLSIQSAVTPASCPDSKDGSVILTITGSTGPFIVLWTEDGFTGPNRSELEPGTYNAVITDHNNCGESIVVNVEFTYTFGCLIIPQVITPNNDGFNDVWRIRNIDLYPNAEVRIFTRWGKMIFSTKNLSDNPWNGTIGGKPAPTDSYHYILYLNDGSAPRSGVISVIR